MTAAENTHEALVVAGRQVEKIAQRLQYDGLTMAISPAEAKHRLGELQAFVKSVMVKDSDYGTIPGTNKPTLYQQGAQKLAEVYGFSHRFEITASKDWDRGFFEFDVRCLLISRRDGSLVAEGVGSANSHESKYRWRWIFEEDLDPSLDKSKLVKQARPKWVFDNEVPAGVDRKKLKTQERESKKPPFRKYMVYDVGGTAYRVPNPDVADVVNTLQKMACKRAYVHAVIGATRSSDLFTQDVEDLPPEVFGQADGKRSWEQDETPDPQPVAAVATTVVAPPAPATQAPAAKDPRRQPPEKPPTDAQQEALQKALDLIDAADSIAALSRALHAIGENVKTKGIHPIHKGQLHEYAKAKQDALKAAPPALPQDDGAPPDDYVGGDNADSGP